MVNTSKMRETTVKISVTQDGLLPEEVTLLGKIFLPAIQKQILKSTGFEKIDDSTFAGVVPIKITTTSMVVDKIKKTPSDLERVYLSMLSTPCKKIVVNKKEKINIPIIE